MRTLFFLPLVVLSLFAQTRLSSPIVVTVPNDTTTGTALHKIASLTSGGKVATASSASGTLGIVYSGAGASGSAAIAVAGLSTCVFDGATTANDYVQATANGSCHDAGSALPAYGTGDVIGRVLSTNASAGTYALVIQRNNGAPPASSGGTDPGALQKAANLSDLASAATARTNLGLGTAATQASSAFDPAGAATAAVVGLAPQASPAFSGVPTAPTPTNGTSTTQLATTQYVQTAISGLSGSSGGSASYQEMRPLRAAVCEQPTGDACGVLAPGATDILMQSTGTEGNVEMIQLAFDSAGDHITLDSHLQVIADGQTVLDGDMGTVMMWHGGPSPFQSKNITIAHVNSGNSVGGYRKINIHWSSSIKVQVVNADGTYPANVYSQVLYRIGAPADPKLKRKFHSYTQTCCTSVAAYGQYSILPTQSLAVGETAGYLDTLNVFYYVVSANAGFQSLEGNPTWTTDAGTASALTQHFGGSEDWYGTQFYGDQLMPHQEEFGMDAWHNPNIGLTCFHGYRFFREYPLAFTKNIEIHDFNGQSSEPPDGTQPPAISVSSFVVWYTE